MKQRILSAVLAAALCLGIIGVVGLSLPAQAAGFSDIGDADVSEAVSVLSSLGIVSGYSDGTFRPSETLTRAQFATLAVLAEGHGDQVAESAYRTLFSDLPASHWAAPYVNLAQSEGLISGYGNGRFGPDDPVTIGQAVTIVLRLMGYGEEDVGPFWPQDYLSKGTDLGLLEGVRTQADAAMTRGEAALLLYAMLQSNCKDGASYVEKLAHTTVSDAVLLQNDDTSPSGEVHTAQVYAGNSGLTWYTQDTALPDTLLNRRGTLLLNESGAVSGFLPDESTVRTLSLAEAKADRLVDESGASYTLSSAVTLVLDDTVTTYGEAWYELDGRETVTLYYSASGSVNLVTASETKRYDGAALTGYYENVLPNASNPTSITLLGETYPVAEEGVSALAQFRVGDRITVSFNGSGEIVDACSPSERSAVMIGLVTETGNSCSVALSNGLTASGSCSDTTFAVGDLVRVSASSLGTLSLSQVSAGTSSAALQVAERTLGSTPLAEDVVLYDRVGKTHAVQITLEDLLVDSVPASDILYTAANSAGEIDVLVLDDVTGDAYTYGIFSSGTKTEGNGTMQVTNRTVAVENSAGLSQECLTGTAVPDGQVGGLVPSSDGRVAGLLVLEEVEDVSRSAFDGTDTVTLSGAAVPISDEVQVYNTDNGQWITLAQAKAYTDTFTVYYSGTLGTDAKVRVILTQSPS